MTTVGIVGAGQLARMLALAGLPLGLRFVMLDPAPDACGAVLGEHLCRNFDDPQALDLLASKCDVVTYEFENVPADAMTRLAQQVPVYPNPQALAISRDRMTEKSLLRAMAASGLRPYLVDWGTPNDEERKFDTTAYVARLERALAFVAKRARRAPAVMGYCMGGTLTVALAARQPRRVAGLALLAAPWDFHADRTGHAFLVSTGPLLAEVADKVGELPVDILQTLFWSLDPWLAMKKFGRFLGMDQQGAGAREFVLLEDWLNDGAPLAGPVARECLVGWYGDNIPGSGKWVVGGRRIVPSKINVPSLVMIPSGDRIVPPLSAAALTDPIRGLQRATRRDVPLGHIGMVVSGRARDLCWEPLIDWLRDIPPKTPAKIRAARR